MKNIKFRISNLKFIELALPSVEKLDYYDIIPIYYFNEDRKFLIGKANVIEIISDMETCILNLLKGELEVKNDTISVGHEYSIQNHEFILSWKSDIPKERPPFSKYGLWLRNYNTWMYSCNGKYYLEISPNYRWDYEDSNEKEVVEPFEKWLKKFNSILKIELKEVQIKEWLSQCNNLGFHMH